MEYYIVLMVGTLLIATLAWLIFVRTRSLAFILGIAFMYYWSMYGAWFIINDSLGGDSGKRYHYLFDELFPVYMDDNYFWSLVLYLVFILIVQITILHFAARPKAYPSVHSNPIKISHLTILLTSSSAGFFSYLIVKDQLAIAAALNISAYAATRGALGEVVPLFTVHQFLNRVSLIPLALGIAILLTGDNARWVRGERSTIVALLYVLAFGGMFIFLTVLGNKNELFSSFVLAALFYLANTDRPRKLLLAVGCALGIGGLALVDFLRALPIVALKGDVDWANALSSVLEIGSSNEAFGAHFSLYGALHYDLPFTYGTSLVSLLASVVPRLFWPGRPDTIYSHYASGVGALEKVEGQGYSIHHVTGWYLNFGVLGVVIGALILGWIWASCFNKHLSTRGSGSRWHHIFAALAPWAFVAYIPPLIRAGPEAYKGLILEGFLIPTIALVFASYNWSKFLHIAAKQARDVERTLLHLGNTR